MVWPALADPQDCITARYRQFRVLEEVPAVWPGAHVGVGERWVGKTPRDASDEPGSEDCEGLTSTCSESALVSS